jgi:hypothetical protein
MNTTHLRRFTLCLLALLVIGVCLPPLTARAEPNSIEVSVRKVKGADFWGRVAGIFRLAVPSQDNLRAVTFYIDGREVGRAMRQPFAIQFNTKDFPKGVHRIEAVAQYTNGSVTTSKPLSLDFRSDNWSLAMRQSMYLYAVALLALCLVGGWIIVKLMHARPRLVLLEK